MSNGVSEENGADRERGNKEPHEQKVTQRTSKCSTLKMQSTSATGPCVLMSQLSCELVVGSICIATSGYLGSVAARPTLTTPA